jgi:dTDP-glucose 4,6-dehydratase
MVAINSPDTLAVGSDQPALDSANILVTGGAGFIGSCFIRYVLNLADFRGKIVNFDALTYAGNLESLADIDERFGGKRYFFERGDIRDFNRVKQTLLDHQIDRIVHFAAESHVDRSIHGPQEFIQTNINGTFTLLEVVRELAGSTRPIRFHQVSTDEVFGSLGETGCFCETTPYDPRSPYSASKAASDHLVRAYAHTYGLSVTLSNCSNNYGPYQFPEKLIPLIILNASEGKPLPIYGDGLNVRDWLFVEDHCSAIWRILARGKLGQTYTIGGECEKTNLEVVSTVCEILERQRPARDNPLLIKKGYKDLVVYVKDRPGHDRRYAIDCRRIKAELGWKQSVNFAQGMEQTIAWYLANPNWVKSVRSGDYRKWIDQNYRARLADQ